MIETKKVRIPLYGGFLYVVVFDNESIPLIKKKFGVDWDVSSTAMAKVANYRGWRTHFIFLHYEEVNHRHEGDIAHEASHTAIDLFTYIGSPINIDTTEPFSYLLGWISIWTHYTYNKFTKKKNGITK